MADIRMVPCSSCGRPARLRGPYGDDGRPLCRHCWREYEGVDEEELTAAQVLEVLVILALVVVLVLAVILIQ